LNARITIRGFLAGFRVAAANKVVPAVFFNRLRYNRRTRWLVAGGTGLAIAAAAVGMWSALPRNAPIGIAVLPLVNVSQDTASDYLADGLASEIISDLSMIEGLEVRSQTSSFALKGKTRKVREAAAMLHADYLLEGSVFRAGQQLRLNTQLVRAHDDVPVWSRKYESPMCF